VVFTFLQIREIDWVNRFLRIAIAVVLGLDLL
jgi:hypothetical protein